jgi:hypothetical protein
VQLVGASIVVGNGFVLPVTSVGDSVLFEPFYLNDVLVSPDLIQNLLSVHQFTTNNSCSMEFDLATRHILVRYDNNGPLYTLPLHTSSTSTPRVVPYALVVAASSTTWHRCPLQAVE